MTSVIVVEDHAELRFTLEECLGKAGLDVVGVGTGMAFYQQLATRKFDVAILDLGLPDQDGLRIAEFLRANTTMGIVILTGRGAVEQRVEGFASGADLYFVKPVDCQELAAAVINLARRVRDPGTPRPHQETWFVDRSHWRLVDPGGNAIQLTPKEMRLVECLAGQAGTPVPRADLENALGYHEESGSSRNLDALVRRLRVKVEGATGSPPPIQTVHGTGYLFSATVSVD